MRFFTPIVIVTGGTPTPFLLLSILYISRLVYGPCVIRELVTTDGCRRRRRRHERDSKG